MAARLSAFVIWALVAGSVVFWGLRLLAQSPPTPSHAVGVGEAGAVRGDIARLLGPDASPTPVAQAEAASRFQLTGVLAPKMGYAVAHGVALIAVDGRPARAYHVGAPLVDDWVLQSVTRRSASLGPKESSAAVVLELPERPAPATGNLPTVSGIETGVPRSPAGAMASPPATYTPAPAPTSAPMATPAPPPMPEAAQPAQPAVPEAPADTTSVDDSNQPGPTIHGGPPRGNVPGAPESR